VAKIDGVDIIAGVNAKLQIGEFLDQWEQTHQPRTIVKPSRDLREFMPSCSQGDRTRYFLKVQDGCDYWCSYCTIPAARGRSRSGLIADLTTQAQQVAADGGKEIVITGVNIGDFGRGNGETFIDLLRALDTVDGIERYRISSIEPNLLTDEVIEFTASSRRFMPHFHIPLQSGSDEVLKLMRRRYDTALFRHKVERIRQIMPDTFIGVDLIVGARGETDYEFAKSKEFIESLDISRLHVFTYSERPGTRALEIEHVVEQAEKHRRTRQMLAVSEQKLREFSSRFIGTTRPVLLEHPHRGHMSGLTDNYLRVEITPIPEAANTVVPICLETLSPEADQFTGSILNNTQA
jgi:threonylcarbamoyladenosine tRNA methylthiotransferase MtaB